MISALVILTFISCDENDIFHVNQNYPSTYTKLESSALEQLRTKLLETNPYLFQTVNDFGFIGDSRTEFPVLPPTIADLTKQEAQVIIGKFITENSAILGIKYREEVNFVKADSSRVYDGSLSWMFTIGNQFYQNIEVYNSALRIRVINGKITYCIGNWFPEIIVPQKFKFDKRKIKSLLLNKVVTHYNIAGQPYTMKITSESLESAEFSNLIYAVESDDLIKIHVVWKVYVPDVYFKFYIDVISGEIINSAPTIIS